MTDKMIVLADLGRVKAYRVTHDAMAPKPQLELVYYCEFIDAHNRLIDRVSDRAGRFALSGTPGASNGENHNLGVETERRLIRQVAQKIGELVEGERYWFLAAGEGINGRIVEQLRPDTRAALSRNLAADLVKTPKQQLLDRFMAPAG